MATLLAITYDEPDRARKAMESVDWSHFEHLIQVKDACWISKDHEGLKVHAWGHSAAGKATAGGALGLLVGAIFGIPVVGIAAGAAMGARKGKHKDIGINDEFVTTIGNQLAAGGSAVIVLFEEGADTARAGADLAQFGGTLHTMALPPERIRRFQAALEEAGQEASPADAADPAS
ncbi:MAG TPA: DUF1269 domain-containing protein [Thermomicrobiales bacterium]|nr:DUF1269 domain-containing protein [Thermomicrobiales bacterium]